MKNFSYHNPVNIVFGKGQIAELSNLISADKKVLITYGGGSVFKNGVMKQVKEALKANTLVEFGGIEPNPEYETLLKAIKVARDEKVDFLLAVGGGSVVDGTKFIAINAFNDFADPYTATFFEGLKDSKGAIPFGCVITLPASGSEMNNVFSVEKRADKLNCVSMGCPHAFPQFSIIDPETTYSLPTRQVANGLVDTFTHILEQYVTVNDHTQIQDYIAVGVLRTLLENGIKAIEDPTNYNVKANVFLASTLAQNGSVGAGRTIDGAVHFMALQFTTIYGLDHGRTLAPLVIADWKIRKAEKHDQLLHMAKNVFGITTGTDEEKIDLTISKTKEFFNSLGVSTRFSDYDTIDKDCSTAVTDKLKSLGFSQIGFMGVSLETAKEIINTAY